MGALKKDDSKAVDVAVKKLKKTLNKKQRIEFIKEAKIMRR